MKVRLPCHLLPPTGWVNDFVFADNNRNGLLEIIAIDHGRELGRGSEDWARLAVYEYDPVSAQFRDLTDRTAGNEVGFYHNAANSADVNQDGYADLIVAQMGPINLRIFLGDPKSIIREDTAEVLGERFASVTAWDSPKFIGVGAAGALDLGSDGDFDFIILPYHDVWATNKNQAFAQLFDFENGALVGDRMINVRSTPALKLPAEWGYSFFRVNDVNRDGRHDIVAFAENPTSSNIPGTGVFVTMIQTSEGGFNVFPSFPNEPLITERRGELFLDRVWQDYKFSLEDLDGDGDLDLFWGHQHGSKSEDLADGIFMNDGTGRFYRDTLTGAAIAEQITWPSNGVARTHMADLNLDGIGDFLVFDQNWDNGYTQTTVKAFYSDRADSSDALRLSGPQVQYDVETKDDRFYVVDRLMTEGRLLVPPSKRVHFDDTSLALDLDGHAGQVARTLGAVFGRDAVTNTEYAGIGLDLLDKGIAYDALMSLALSAKLGDAPNHAAVVDLLYTNLFEAAPLQAERDFYLGLLDSGSYTPASLGVLAAETSLNAANIDLVGLSQTGLTYLPV